MKTRCSIWMAMTALMFLVGCSRPVSEPTETVAPLPTPNLRRDAELLREATTKAAEARKREEAEAAAKGVNASPALTSPAPPAP